MSKNFEALLAEGESYIIYKHSEGLILFHDVNDRDVAFVAMIKMKHPEIYQRALLYAKFVYHHEVELKGLHIVK